MSLKASLYTYLSTYAGLTALIGTRIYPSGDVPQGPVIPYCVYSRPNSERVYSHQGFSSLTDDNLQINCYSTTTLSVEAIEAQVIAAIEAWPATNGSVQAAFVDNVVGDLYDPQTELQFSAIEISIAHSF
jgi:hypothetical protein